MMGKVSLETSPKNIMIQDMINSKTIWIRLNRQTQTYSRRINVVGDMTIYTSIFLHFKNSLCSEQLCHCQLKKLTLRNIET